MFDGAGTACRASTPTMSLALLAADGQTVLGRVTPAAPNFCPHLDDTDVFAHGSRKAPPRSALGSRRLLEAHRPGCADLGAGLASEGNVWHVWRSREGPMLVLSGGILAAVSLLVVGYAAVCAVKLDRAARRYWWRCVVAGLVILAAGLGVGGVGLVWEQVEGGSAAKTEGL
jgi:hypothetical protein